MDTDRRRGRPDEPETNNWPLEGPEEQDSGSISWRNPSPGCPQEQAKRFPDRFVIKRFSRRVAGEPVQVTTYYGPDVAELIRQAEVCVWSFAYWHAICLAFSEIFVLVALLSIAAGRFAQPLEVFSPASPTSSRCTGWGAWGYN